MQISNSVQTPETVSNGYNSENSGEIRAETLQNSSVFQSKDSKKAKQGLFPRLLENLGGKTRKNLRETLGKGGENSQNTKEQQVLTGISLLREQKPEKSILLLNKSIVKSEKTDGNPEISSRDSALEQQDNVLEDLPQNTGEVPPDAALPEIAVQAAAESSAPPVSAEAGQTEKQAPLVPALAVETGTNNSSVGTEPLPAAAETIIVDAQTREKPRAGRAAVDVFPARNLESRAYQFSGEPKPAAVDSVPGQEREKSRIGEVRAKKGRERAVFEVQDLRTDGGGTENALEPAVSTTSLFSAAEKIDADISVDLNLGAARDNFEKVSAQSLDSGTLESALSRELSENLNSDIVRQASVILRNGGEGLIRLSLKPESLGNVKIRLEMTENKITGQIIVESSEALRAFERELPVLEKAFRDSGFSETNLDMFLAQDHGNYNPERQRDRDLPAILPETAVSNYETETDRSVVESSGSGFAERTTVNMLI